MILVNCVDFCQTKIESVSSVQSVHEMTFFLLVLSNVALADICRYDNRTAGFM